MPYICSPFRKKQSSYREHSSVGLEHLPYKQRVGGSTPSAPTKALDFSKAFSFIQPLLAWNSKLQPTVIRFLSVSWKFVNFVRLYLTRKINSCNNIYEIQI